MENKELCKVAAIDGPSLWNLMRCQRAGDINYGGLMSLLRRCDNKLPFAEQPRITLHKQLAKKGNPVYDDIADNGFEVFPAAATNDGSDDKIVSGWLSEWSCRSEVRVMVVLTCDGGIIEDSLDLADRRRGQSRPLIVLILGTQCNDPDSGRCIMSSRVLQRIKETPGAHFCDLKNYLARISFR